MSLFGELKRRNVIRMAGLYLVGAWLVTQVAGTILPMFEAPGWVARSVVILLAIGFVPAMVFSWVFELTPEGLKRDSEVASADSIAPQTARRMDRMIIVVLLVALAYFAIDKFVLAPASDAGEAASGTQKPDASAKGSAKPETPQASIAVLPFVNMSTDAENGFFADGISEELLNVLARVNGLKVASRTSAFSFKGKDTPIPDIARQLGVQHVLEGSVRKQGQRVRITAQLIHAGSDGHLWSETYDRDLTDIFKVQEEIAQAITRELEGILGKRQVVVAASTSNLGAYQSFLRGRARFHRRDELPEAVEDLSSAVEQDPEFAEAWIYLAATWAVIPGYNLATAVDAAKTKAQARTALQRAAALAPDHPMVPALEGFLRALDADQVGALALMERSSKLSVTDSTPMMWRGMRLLQTGYIGEAIAVLEQAQAMDPLAGINNGYLAIAYLSDGRYPLAEATARRAAGLGWNPAIFVVLYDLAARGERQRALALWDEYIDPPASDRDAQRDAAVRRLLINPDDAGARSALSSLQLETDGSIEYLLAIHDYDSLLDLAQQSSKQPAVYNRLQFWNRMAWLPSSLALREDPRYFSIAERNGALKLWETRGYPPGCRRVDSPKGEHLDCSGAPE